jgi:glycosyltransferase involved in cell wall biosynthesis
MGSGIDGSDEETPLLSVIIPCKNDGTYLSCQLDALVSQETSFPWELVFVDNGSTDRSVLVAQEYATRLRLKIISAPDRANSAYARNVGAKAARAGKLVFVDADDEVAPGFLSTMFSSLQNHDFVASILDYLPLNPEWAIHAHDLPRSSGGSLSLFASGSGMGLSRQAFESVGGFPEEYEPGWDAAISYRLQQEGFALVYLQALHRYRLRSTIGDLFHQTRMWGYCQPLVHRDFPRFVPRRPMSMVLSEWFLALRDLVGARSKADLARCAVRLGYSVGRLQGSVRHRVFYL